MSSLVPVDQYHRIKNGRVETVRSHFRRQRRWFRRPDSPLEIRE